jgi:hypothetical protein
VYRKEKFCGVPSCVFRKLGRTVDEKLRTSVLGGANLGAEISSIYHIYFYFYFYLMTAALLASETLCSLTKSGTTEMSNVHQSEINVGDRFP